MKYLAITQKTADWLLRTSQAKDTLLNELENLAFSPSLHEGILAIGSLRVCANRAEVLCIWNIDYIGASGVEEWGFILLGTENGIFSNFGILPEVFERSLFIINQRLQGLFLPDDIYIHRSLGDNIHCCLAGRGSLARKSSIGYKEGIFSCGETENKSVLIVGPWSGNKDNIKKLVEKEAKQITELLSVSSKIITAAAKRPVIDSSAFLGLRQYFSPHSATRGVGVNQLPVAEIPTLAQEISQEKAYETLNWTYDQWVNEGSPLSLVQRKIFDGDILLKQPLRLIGAAGSGKTLLMQLLCIKRLEFAKQNNNSLRVFYVVHNNEMAETMINRFITLGAASYLDENSNQRLKISTLFGYSQDRLGLKNSSVIDKDAYQTKQFQRNLIKDCFKKVSVNFKEKIESSNFLKTLHKNLETQDIYADLIGAEIGIAIKGRDLGNDEQKYVTSEKPLTRFHGALTQAEREFIFKVYREYHSELFENLETLDSDDIAISLLGHFRTPLWEMRRKSEGFDFVFIDETQLFNENERYLFHLLTKEDRAHLPIALALDEAQALHGATTSGFGSLGIENLSNQMLYTVHRCTESILKLAFYMLQRTSDLFTADFPDFTTNTITLVPDEHPLAIKPTLSVLETQSIGKSILREVRTLRKKNIRQIAIVVHAEKYWSEIVEYFTKTDRELPMIVQLKRGEKIDQNTPIVVITRPEIVGGQEFDAVLAIGIEKGLVPPIVKNHSGLQTALEQQALREMYLSFTRARYILIIVNSNQSHPSPILKGAIDQGLIVTSTTRY